DTRRALPTSRFDLYEAYLGYLADGRHFHADAAADHLRERLNRDPAGPRLVEQVETGREELLEHLAITRVDTDRSLLEAAQQYLAARDASPMRPPPDWPSLVAGALSLTGPLVPRGSDVDFLHHSFAEHHAAAHRARTLPDRFDPTAPAWID